VFKWLFGNRNATVATTEGATTDADLLLKQATAQKRAGGVEAAIRTLRVAYGQIAKGSLAYSVDTFLRLPLYLQEAGRSQEAWSEFNKLIVDGYPNQVADLGVRAMDQGKVYDKMRLFLQREGKYLEAVVYATLQVLAFAKGLHLQKRQGEFAKHVTRKNIRLTLEPPLKKARGSLLLERLVDLVLDELGNISRLDLSTVAERVRELTRS
jgi:tetratricopeptide (TPR) repeat protein